MHRFAGISADGHARVHNGDITYNIASKQRQDDSDTEPDKALTLSPRVVRPLDARFGGDEQAIIVWLKKNNLRVSKFKRAAVEGESLIDRMSSYSVYRTYQRLAGRKLLGTTEWILDTPEYGKWLASFKSVELFLVGKVGSGKTTLMTTIVQSALDASFPKAPVLSFFFEQPSRSMIDLFASLTQQLLRHMIAAGKTLSSELQSAVQQLYNEELTKPTLEEIQKELFEPVLWYFPGCVILIDGIDNAGGSRLHSTALYFRKLLKKMEFKVLISTRDDLDLPLDVARIHLASKLDGSVLNDIDIRNYVDAKLKDLARPGKLLADELLRNMVRYELLLNAKGMFLWVVLQIEVLFGRDDDDEDDGVCHTAEDVRRNIKQMPQGLEGIYESCIRRQTGPQARYTARMLRWVCASPEPTHIDNLRELLAFEPTTKLLSKDAIPPKDSILRAATNLVVLESSDQATSLETVSRSYLLPIHSTVRDFVFSKVGQNTISEVTGDTRHWTQPDTVLELGGICAAYLLAFSGHELTEGRKVVSSQVPSTPMLNKVYDTSLSSGMARVAKKATGWWSNTPEKHSTTLRRPQRTTEEVEVRLLNYARRNWHTCLRHARKDSEQYADFKALVFEHADALHRPWSQDRKSSKRSQVESLCFWALVNDHPALLDLAVEEATLQRLLPAIFWSEPLAVCGEVPLLHFAVERCSEAIVARLLPLCRYRGSYSRRTALHCAVESASSGVVSLLLGYVEGNSFPFRQLHAKDTNGRNVLHLAAIRGNVEVFQVVCEQFKPLWAQNIEELMLDHAKCSPLHYALLNESFEMVDGLIEACMIINKDEMSGGTLDKLYHVASPGIIAHVVSRLATKHNLTANWETTWKSGSMPSFQVSSGTERISEHIILAIVQRRIASGNLHPKACSSLCEWLVQPDRGHRSSTSNQNLLIELHKSPRAHGLDPKVLIRLKDGVNLAGWAVLYRNEMLASLVALDPGYFETEVRPQDEHIDGQMRPKMGTPVQLAARRGLMDAVEICAAYSPVEANRRAMIAAAIEDNYEVFEWLRAACFDRFRKIGYQMDLTSLGSVSQPHSVLTISVKANLQGGCLVIPFSEDASVLGVHASGAPYTTTIVPKLKQYATLPASRVVDILIHHGSANIRFCIIQRKPSGESPAGTISLVGSSRDFRCHESDNDWICQESDSQSTWEPNALTKSFRARSGAWVALVPEVHPNEKFMDTEPYHVRSWVLQLVDGNMKLPVVNFSHPARNNNVGESDR